MSSGWIKFEKDLRADLRVKRIAKSLGELHPALCNAGAFQDSVILITVVLGGLAQLWMHADTFARDDDTLDITADEIDQLAGIQGFSQILPSNWLHILDPDCVELPGFQEHNGSEAKRKAQTAKRVSKHRATHSKRINVTDTDQPVTQVRYQTRPDQTRQDQTRPTPEVPSEHVEPERSTVAVKPPNSKATEAAETVGRVFDHWRTIHHHARAALDDKRRKLIRKALEHYSEADLCQAISGYLNSPHHMGQNDRATVYTDIELLLRDSGQIDNGLKFYAEPPRTDLGTKTRANIAAIADWKPPELRNADR